MRDLGRLIGQGVLPGHPGVPVGLRSEAVTAEGTMNRDYISVPCRTENCAYFLGCHFDAPLPKDFLCPSCEGALNQQMVDDLEQRELARKLVELANAKERENGRDVEDTF
jgi:hypothetical protein